MSQSLASNRKAAPSRRIGCGTIVGLRIDEKYNKHLSTVTADVEAQVNWIRSYKEDEANKQQFYFIIERLDGERAAP